MSDQRRAIAALQQHRDNRMERGTPITAEQYGRAWNLLVELLPLAERYGVTDHGVNLHLARAVLDAVLAPPRKPPRKERLRRSNSSNLEISRSSTERR